MSLYRRGGKRLLDVTVAIVAGLLLAPVIAVVVALVALRLGRPVLFRQRRPGRHGHAFEILKFRSMTEQRGADGRLLDDAVRLTPLGRALRASSLDELPELWNVVCGDMSLVGPRPLLTEYLPRYTTEQARRHEVRPGITGWAQVHGRNELSWEEKFARDVWYVDNYNLVLDLKILGITIRRVLTRHGISAQGHDTMPKFEGSDE
jgi:lipopolysaccharide/colanic/teichoic acid biosynthesis glycosyltransferase